MTWIPGVGELAKRIARGLTVKGRIVTELDEQIISMVQLANLGVPPFRTDGRWAFMYSRHTKVTATNFNTFGIYNPTDQNQILDAIYMSATGNSSYIIGMGFNNAVPFVPGGATSLMLGRVPFITMENVKIRQVNPAFDVPFSYTPILLTGYEIEPAFLPRTTDFQLNTLIDARNTDVPNLQIVIPPKSELFVTDDRALAGTTNFSARIQYFQNAPEPQNT